MAPDATLSSKDFERIATTLRTRVGISLTEQKRSLLLARLGSMMRALGYRSYGQLADELDADPDGQTFIELVNRLSTNHTYFYREPQHFTFLREQIMPVWQRELRAGARERVRVWSAACSSGEEPYNIAMTLAEDALLTAHVRVLGTDIAATALEVARDGVYRPEAIEKLPEAWRRRYVEDHPAGGRMNETLRRIVVFRRLNLIRDTYPFQNTFDLIFCRNVLIYFEQSIRASVIGGLVRQLAPGGFLVVGHSETIERRSFGLSYVRPGVYRYSPQAVGGGA
jgi:chemotaxis protein methyltransferase CheR